MIKLKPIRLKKVSLRMNQMNSTFAIVVLILLGVGIITMFSASYAIAINEGKPGYYYALRQLQFAGVGLVVMFITSCIDYHEYQRFEIAVGSYIGSVLLLIAVIFVGTDLGTGCKRWIRLPFNMTFQPSELAKFAIVILFAYYIDLNFDKMRKYMFGTLPFVGLLGIIAAFLIKQPHLSCTLLIAMMGFSMLFIGGAKFWHLIVTGIVGLIAITIAISMKVISGEQTYFLTRIKTWFHPFDYTEAYQTQQSLIAIGSGGAFGLGLGESRQKYLYLPESENDFVFSIICEELGLVGAVTIILLFGMLVALGFQTALRSKDRFGMLVASGFTLQIGLQAFINIAVVSNLFPNTGISLPFFSYGGTALIMQLAEMGIVLNISKSRYVVDEKQPPDKPDKKVKAIKSKTTA